MAFFLKQPRDVWLATIFSAMIWPASASADDTPTKPSLGFSGGVEHFHEAEFSGSGSRLLSESGGRYLITALLDDKERYNRDVSFFYHIEASAYLGQINYNGRSQSLDPAQNNIPLDSKTNYQGGRTEALVGYRFKPFTIRHPVEVIGGVGFDGWSRRIQDGTAANGTLVSGIQETYRATYGKIALGLTDVIPSTWHNHLQFGLKTPFSITEDVGLRDLGYDNDVSLSPGNTYSGFIKLIMESPPDKDHPGTMLFSVYYDGFRFNPSDSVTAFQNGNPVQVYQPETHIDIIGAQLGYHF